MNENQESPSIDSSIYVPNQDSLSSISQSPQDNLMKEKNNKNITLIVIIAFLLLILGAVGMYLIINGNKKISKEIVCNQDTKQCTDGSYVQRVGPNCEFAECPTKEDPTADWKTYTNTKYGYSIEYPSNWTYREFPDTKNGAGFRLESEPNDLSHEHIIISYSKRDGESIEVPFETYVKQAAVKETQSYLSLVSINEVKTNSGITGYKTTWDVQEMGQATGKTFISLPITYFDTKDSYGGTVQVRLENSNYVELYNQILSTFKFSDQTSNTETLNWKTYTSSGFSFKYPADWISSDFSIAGREIHHGLVTLKPSNVPSDPSVPLQISYWDNPDNLTIQDYHNKINEGAGMIYPLYDNSARVVLVGGLDTYLTPNGDCSPSICNRYVIPYNGKIWEIGADIGDYKEVVEKIITTIKFSN